MTRKGIRKVRRSNNVNPLFFRKAYNFLHIPQTCDESLGPAEEMAKGLGKFHSESLDCNHCKKRKHRNDFGKNILKESGLRDSCKYCTNRLQAKRDVKKRDGRALFHVTGHIPNLITNHILTNLAKKQGETENEHEPS